MIYFPFLKCISMIASNFTKNMNGEIEKSGSNYNFTTDTRFVHLFKSNVLAKHRG